MTPIIGTKNSNLASPLQMTGIDNLHAMGIKRKGMKIVLLDTGVDYRHPALGGGFERGHKIVGGYSFMDDSGALINGSDPFADCLHGVGGHGTHVTGELFPRACLDIRKPANCNRNRYDAALCRLCL
jgi:subtilisin family serine protease